MKNAPKAGTWTPCNRICEEREKHRIAYVHKQAVADIYSNKPRRPGTSSAMESPREFPHLAELKGKKMKDVRETQVQLENRVLVQKMLKIDGRPNTFSQMASTQPGPRTTPRSLNTVAKKVETQRIQEANSKMFERISKMRATTERRRREDNAKEMDRQALSARVSENSNRVHMWHLPRPEARTSARGPSLDALLASSYGFSTRGAMPERGSTAPLPLEDSTWSPRASTQEPLRGSPVLALP